MGPLGGLNAALHHAAAQGYDAVLTTGCDVPVYPDGLAQALIGDGAAILKGQQLAGFWLASLAGGLDAHLAEENSRAIHGWLERVGARIREARTGKRRGGHARGGTGGSRLTAAGYKK